nr:MAG TPA: hypothetical protein [Caudoviricetes sp.]
MVELYLCRLTTYSMFTYCLLKISYLNPIRNIIKSLG